MKQAVVVYHHDAADPSGPGWIVLDRDGRVHTWCPVDAKRADSRAEAIRLEAHRDAQRKAQKVADDLNARGARRERALKEAGL